MKYKLDEHGQIILPPQLTKGHELAMKRMPETECNCDGDFPFCQACEDEPVAADLSPLSNEEVDEGFARANRLAEIEACPHDNAARESVNEGFAYTGFCWQCKNEGRLAQVGQWPNTKAEHKRCNNYRRRRS